MNPAQLRQKQVYDATVVAGIKQACDRARRERKPVIVWGNGKMVWVRIASEGVPPGAKAIGEANYPGVWKAAES